MALTPSNMLDLGTRAPEFVLTDVISGNPTSFHNVKGEKGTLVMFICNHCPYVIHYFTKLVEQIKTYQKMGIGVVAISSNDVINYPEDAPDKMSIVAKVLQFSFPYLYDETQSVAKNYDAACTPDFYLFNADDSLVYRGRYDDSRPYSETPITGQDLQNAIDNMLSGKETVDQYPSMGCNIKWLK